MPIKARKMKEVFILNQKPSVEQHAFRQEVPAEDHTSSETELPSAYSKQQDPCCQHHTEHPLSLQA